MAYTLISPAQGCDGNWYVDAKMGSAFSAYHLDFERERGNLHQVLFTGFEVETEEAIPEGALVSFGGTKAKIWTFAV